MKTLDIDNLPFVSSMIVTHNEKDYITQCFSSLLGQDYPSEKYEIIIIDGLSTDGTVDIINDVFKQYVKEHEGDVIPKLTVLFNPKHILASGWNIGIKAAVGDYVVRIDGHAYADKSFISKSVETILEVGDAVCVGGSIITVSDSDTGNLIVEALSCPFGVGGSKFRYQKIAGYVDTVPYGLYKKTVFDEIGYFNEGLVRTQDNDLHRRVRAAGGKFYLNPDIKSYYYSRNTIKKLVKQQFQNGKWTMINFRSNPGRMSIRHFVPFVFVCSLLLLFALGCLWHWIWLLLAAELLFYTACGFYFGSKQTKLWKHRLKLPICFFLMHLFYGFGSLAGIFCPKVKNN